MILSGNATQLTDGEDVWRHCSKWLVLVGLDRLYRVEPWNVEVRIQRDEDVGNVRLQQ